MINRKEMREMADLVSELLVDCIHSSGDDRERALIAEVTTKLQRICRDSNPLFDTTKWLDYISQQTVEKLAEWRE